MSNTQIGQVSSRFKNSLKAVANMGGSTTGLNTPVNYTSISALDSALNTANSTYYTQAKLDSMTVNDKVFALRNMQDATTIANYMSNSSA